jgi:hypothetical protein
MFIKKLLVLEKSIILIGLVITKGKQTESRKCICILVELFSCMVYTAILVVLQTILVPDLHMTCKVVLYYERSRAIIVPKGCYCIVRTCMICVAAL